MQLCDTRYSGHKTDIFRVIVRRVPAMTIGIILVDHGSRRAESNQMLLAAAEKLAESMPGTIVEPAHMELAEPSIALAFQECIRRGAKEIVVFPYFLSPGRHWTEDIPDLVRKAAADYPNVRWVITAPFGLHPLMQQIIQDRIQVCLSNAGRPGGAGCDVCQTTHQCEFRMGGPAE